MVSFDGVVVVTGGAGGLGAAVAEGLSNAAKAVIVADIDGAGAQRVADDLACESTHYRFDLADRESCRALVDFAVNKYGRIDALVNAAGIDSPPGRAWEIDDAHWQRLIDVDLTGQWWCARAALDEMMHQRYGRIVFISSVAGRVGSDTDSPAYAAAKAGLIGLTVSLARQLEPFGVLVNAVAPGTVGTTGTPLTKAQADDYLKGFPLGFGGTGPVVDAVRYLLDSSGDWISGTTMNVSGGKLRGI